ncbi:Atp-dependent dna helicase, partial [Globisporangium splendens]
MMKIMHSLTDLVTPKPTALIPVTNGSEEIELVMLSDMLARAGVRVTIAVVSDDPNHIVTLMKGTMIQGDKAIEHCEHEEYDLIVVPGGSGAKILGANSMLAELLRKQKEAGKLYGGICAAPVDVLLRHAVVTGPMTCFPGYREQVGLWDGDGHGIQARGAPAWRENGAGAQQKHRLPQEQAEATVVLLDAGVSMRAPLCERVRKSRSDADSKELNTRFDAAVAAVESFIQQKASVFVCLFFKPKDEVGIVAYGSEGAATSIPALALGITSSINHGRVYIVCDEDGYRNVSILWSIDTPTLHMCERLRELKPASESSDTKVDILDGLIVALDLLFRRTEGKKYEKRLLVITDAAERITDAADVESVVQMIQNMDVKLQIIGIDFTNTTDDVKKEEVQPDGMKPEDSGHDVKREDAAMSSVKVENEKMLVSIAQEVGGEVNAVSKRMHLLAQGMKKTVALTTKFRGMLEIGSDFGIPVFCYLKTKVATLPRLSKESQVSYDKETQGKVKVDRRYTTPQNPDEEVAFDQQVKAYRYGKEKVPFSSADVEFFKLQTEKSLKVLGFLAKKLLTRSKFADGTDVFIAEPGKPHAAQCLAALIEGMKELDQVAIARFVARKNAAPKIVALIPHSPGGADNYYAFWSQQLPYEEDLRNYEFAPLKTSKHRPSDAQQATADKLVDSLSVRDDKVDEFGSCFNPVVHRFFHAMSTRAFQEDAAVPPLPSYVDTCLNIDDAKKQRIQPVIQSFGDEFQLKEAVKTRNDRKKKSFWSDAAVTGLPVAVKEEPRDGDDDDAAADPAQDDDAGSDVDLDELLDSGDVTSVGSMNPIADFESLLDLSKSNRSKRAVAVHGMETQIATFLTSGSSFYRKAVQCLSHFRKCSVEILYSSQFNDFLMKLKTTLGETSDAWKAIENDSITLLSSDDDPTLSVTPAQARAFLYGDEQVDVSAAAAASLPSQVEEMEQEDDMFAEFE